MMKMMKMKSIIGSLLLFAGLVFNVFGIREFPQSMTAGEKHLSYQISTLTFLFLFFLGAALLSLSMDEEDKEEKEDK